MNLIKADPQGLFAFKIVHEGFEKIGIDANLIPHLPKIPIEVPLLHGGMTEKGSGQSGLSNLAGSRDKTHLAPKIIVEANGREMPLDDVTNLRQ